MLLGLMVEHRAFLCCATHQASSRHSRSSGPQKATTFAESTCTSTRCAVFDHPLIKRHVLHKTQPNSKLFAPPQCDCALYDSRATRAYSPHAWAPTLVYGLQRHCKNAIVPSDCARRFLRRNQHLRARPSNVERAGLRGRIQALFGNFKPGP